MVDQNFYETLEVSPDATLQEIERAYRIARATYHPTSAATYSVFSEEENSQILRRVEEAFSVLSEARLRREYDARLRREEFGERARAPRAPGPRIPAEPVQVRVPVPASSAQTELDLDEPVEPEDGIYDGPVLRRIRMSRGIEIEEISALTKVGELYLQFIEANRYHDLPAPVYLRGFLREFAKCLKLDPQRVADSYMGRYRERAGKEP
jgi:curved DNA-binding protein CbpA